MIDIKYIEANYNFFIHKNKKSENDIYNNIRENIINIFLKNYSSDLKLTEKPKILFNNFCNTLKNYGIKNITSVKHIGGRNNYDFEIEYQDINDFIHNTKLEFKNGSLSINSLPQFFQIYTKNIYYSFIKYPYHEFFYRNYLDKILDHLKTKNIIIDKPDYDTYIRGINDTTSSSKFTSNLSFHQKLYKSYSSYKSYYKKIMNDSIKEYLKKYGTYEFLELNILTNLLIDKQKNKKFLMTKYNKFFIQDINNYLNITSFKEIKNNNTLVFNSINNTEIHCLLRWKNGMCCRGPAWQISLKFKYFL